MNIKKIAELSGVSIGTVDRVLHNRGQYSEKTAKKVLRIAKEGGYEPNNLASRLRTKEKINFGVLIPLLGSECGYWQQIYDGVREAEKELKNQMVSIVYSFYDRTSPDSFKEASEKLFDSDIKAYIVAPLLPSAMERVAIEHPEVPFVFIDSSLPKTNVLADFSQDADAAGIVAARIMSFIPRNFDKIFTLQRFSDAFNGKRRAASFTANLRKFKNNANIENLVIDDNSGIERFVGSLDKNGSYGMFIVNERAHSVCDILKQFNLIGNFSIIGFDLSPYNRKELEEGNIFAILGQRPRTQAYDAIMLLFKQLVLKVKREMMIFRSPVDIYIKENIPGSDYWL